MTKGASSKPAPVAPHWLFEVAKDSCVDSKTMRQIFGYSSTGFDDAIAHGIIPQPDWKVKRSWGSKHMRKRMWRVSTVIRTIRDWGKAPAKKEE